MRKISKAGSENRTAIESCTVLFLCHGCFSGHCDKTYGSLSEFQSTLPVRGATFFLPQPPKPFRISIHAPREGSDCRVRDAASAAFASFQSTLPVRGATPHVVTLYNVSTISIHAPREGSDPAELSVWTGKRDFNPRSP